MLLLEAVRIVGSVVYSCVFAMQVRAPTSGVMHEQRDATSGRFSFTASEGGSHEFCISNFGMLCVMLRHGQLRCNH